MNIYTPYRFRIKQFILILALFLIGIVSAQNTLEKQSFETLSHHIDHHTKSDSLYFDYLKAYENKAQETGDLEKLFYVKSKYIVHSSSFEIRLKHAEEFLDLAKQQNNQRYIGLAKNKLALVYYMERDLEQSLHYELLAEEFGTNVKYLSEVINTSRHQNFTNYLNQLRIAYAKEQLCVNKKLQLMTIQALAEEFGFNTARNFSEAFLKYNGIKLSFYISQLKND